jgi:hypothetical protein
MARFGEHCRRLDSRHWAVCAARITWELYASRDVAEMVEAATIRAENPQHNIACNDPVPETVCPHPTREQARAMLNGY